MKKIALILALVLSVNSYAGVGRTAKGSSLATPVSEANGGTNQSTYTKGDLIYSSATNTLSKLAIGTQEQELRVSSSGVPYFADEKALSNNFVFSDDFMDSLIHWPGSTTSGAGSALTVNSNSTFGNPSVLMQLGTTSGGYASLSQTTGNNPIKLASGTIKVEYIIKLSALSDGTDRYVAEIGLMDTRAAGSSTNGVWMKYSDNVNTGKWLTTAMASSVQSTQNTNIAAVAATPIKLGFVINAAATSVQGYINDVAVGSPVTTNIPTAQLQLSAQMYKTLGTTNRTMEVDAVRFGEILTTPR